MATPGDITDAQRGATRWRAAGAALALAAGCHGEVFPIAADAQAPASVAGPSDAAAAELTACPGAVAAGEVAGGFVDLTAAVEGLLPRVPPAPALGDGVLSIGVIGDADGDGAADVLLGAVDDPAGSVGFRYDAASGALAPLPGSGPTVRGLLDLDGDGRDEAVAMLVPPAVRWGGDGAYRPLLPAAVRHAALAMWFDDLDHDGWIDVLVSDDTAPQCGSASTVRAFLQAGPRRFDERADLVPARVSVGEGAIISGPVGARRFVGAVGDQSRCAQPLFFEEGAADAEGYPTFRPARLVDARLGAPMGAVLGDLDGDGVFDLAVSAVPTLRLWRGGAAAPLAAVPGSGGMGMLLGELGQALKPWAVALLDLDRDGRPDAVITRGNHHVTAGEPPIGPHRTTVHLHRGGDGFCMSEVDGALGLDRAGDWRSLAVGDLDGDGDPDLVVGGRGHAPRVYRNDLGGPRRGLGLRLRGTTSNPLGVGARVDVRVTPAGPTQHHLVGGYAPPMVVTAPLVWVGLGDADAAGEVTVRWPSGTVQVLRGLAAGRTHLVVEPPSLTVTPAARRAPADGAAIVRLRVTAFDEAGAIAPAAVVRARLVVGGGTLGEPARVGTDVVIPLTSPRERGSSVVEVSVDGRPLGVRPRIWWE